MKRNKVHLLLMVFTITSLAALVGIQISWILKTARMQETQFRHAVALVLNRTVENLSNENAICAELANCLRDSNMHSCAYINQNRAVFSQLDSLIRYELQNLNIELDFEFEVIEKGTVQVCPSKKNVFVQKTLDGVVPNSGYELSIRFPEKKEFIKAQMGSIFISSIALLMLIGISIVLIYRFLEQERRMTRNIIDFVNNITHEIKTPLTNIALASSIISKHKAIESDEKLSAYARVIRTEHQSMKEKIDIMLKATLMESDIPMEVSEFLADEEICSIVDSFGVQLNAKQGSVSIRKQGDVFTLSGNVDLFRIAIGNLIDNAIKYCKSAPEISIDIESKGNYLRIAVTDNGIGIPQKNLPQVFDKYYRVKNGDVHDYEGFGLGLYFVKSIVTRMKGHVFVESTPGKGSVFTLKIPLVCS